MLFTIPIVYNVEIIRPRCRNVERVVCGEWIEVNVAEVSDADAPVATRWKAPYGRDAVDGVHETRWFDGQHYAPEVTSNASNEGALIAVDDVEERCRRATPYGNPLVSGSDWQLRSLADGKIEPLHRVPVRTLVSSARDAVIEAAHAHALQTLIVDGTFWRVRDEPLYHVRQSGGFHRNYVYIDIIGARAATGNYKARDVFRADRWDDAFDYARSICGDGDNLAELSESRIDVYCPQSINHDDETPALIEAARDALSWDADHLSDKERETVLSWLDLRDCFRSATRTGAPDDLRSLENALAAYGRVQSSDWAAHNIEKALQRWAMRPMGFDAAMGVPGL